MAALPDNDRIACWAESMQPNGIGGVALTKAQLRAAVDAIDDWVDANSTAFNSAIPQPARSVLTAKQKAALLMLVVQRRHGVL